MPKAKNLIYLRCKSCMTQKQLADALGVSEVTIHNWECKNTAMPAPATKRAAKYFNVSYVDFCDEDLELMDAQINIHGVSLTSGEMIDMMKFRGLPDNVKEAITNLIAALYENMQQKGDKL